MNMLLTENEEKVVGVIANKYCGAHCTLHGCPAVILGRLNQFAVVRDDKGRDVEYSWHAVRNVMLNSEGKFE